MAKAANGSILKGLFAVTYNLELLPFGLKFSRFGLSFRFCGVWVPPAISMKTAQPFRRMKIMREKYTLAII